MILACLVTLGCRGDLGRGEGRGGGPDPGHLVLDPLHHRHTLPARAEVDDALLAQHLGVFVRRVVLDVVLLDPG